MGSNRTPAVLPASRSTSRPPFRCWQQSPPWTDPGSFGPATSWPAQRSKPMQGAPSRWHSRSSSPSPAQSTGPSGPTSPVSIRPPSGGVALRARRRASLEDGRDPVLLGTARIRHDARQRTLAFRSAGLPRARSRARPCKRLCRGNCTSSGEGPRSPSRPRNAGLWAITPSLRTNCNLAMAQALHRCPDQRCPRAPVAQARARRRMANQLASP